MGTEAEGRRTSVEEELLAAAAAVHRFALHLTRDTVRAEDLVQETYLKAWVHRDQYEPGSNARAWLFRICRNVFLKGEQRTDRETAIEDAELEALGAAGLHASVAGSDPEGTVFERPELDAVLQRALMQLPEEYRTVVTCVDLEDQSYANCAEILGVPLGTVRSRLFRGRRRAGRRTPGHQEGDHLMVSCKQVMERLWDYLDGELSPEAMGEFAEHIAACKRCYPQYQFEFSYLEALARQRHCLPGPSDALVQHLRAILST
jgi:RNA polymerase sigma-70 factor (ECF subfamily)